MQVTHFGIVTDPVTLFLILISSVYTMSRSSKMIPTKTAGSSPVHISSMAWNFKIFGTILLFVEMVLGVVSLWKAGYDLNTNFPEVIVMSSKQIMALVMRNIMAKSAGYDEEMVKLLEKNRDHSPVDQITGRVFVVSVSGIFILISFVLFALSLASLITRSFKRSAPVYEMICHLISFGAHLLAALALNMQIGIQGETFVNSEMMRRVVWIVIANSTLNFVSAIVSLLSCREFMITDRETTA